MDVVRGLVVMRWRICGVWKDGRKVHRRSMMVLSGHWRRSVLERLTYRQPGVEAGVHAMPEMVLAAAGTGRPMVFRLWMLLWSL